MFVPAFERLRCRFRRMGRKVREVVSASGHLRSGAESVRANLASLCTNEFQTVRESGTVISRRVRRARGLVVRGDHSFKQVDCDAEFGSQERREHVRERHKKFHRNLPAPPDALAEYHSLQSRIERHKKFHRNLPAPPEDEVAEYHSLQSHIERHKKFLYVLSSVGAFCYLGVGASSSLAPAVITLLVVRFCNAGTQTAAQGLLSTGVREMKGNFMLNALRQGRQVQEASDDEYGDMAATSALSFFLVRAAGAFTTAYASGALLHIG